MHVCVCVYVGEILWAPVEEVAVLLTPDVVIYVRFGFQFLTDILSKPVLAVQTQLCASGGLGSGHGSFCSWTLSTPKDTDLSRVCDYLLMTATARGLCVTQ